MYTCHIRMKSTQSMYNDTTRLKCITRELSSSALYFFLTSMNRFFAQSKEVLVVDFWITCLNWSPRVSWVVCHVSQVIWPLLNKWTKYCPNRHIFLSKIPSILWMVNEQLNIRYDTLHIQRRKFWNRVLKGQTKKNCRNKCHNFELHLHPSDFCARQTLIGALFLPVPSSP